MPTRKPTAKVVPMPRTAVQRQVDQQEAVIAFWKEATKLVAELRRIAHYLAEEAKAKGGL